MVYFAILPALITNKANRHPCPEPNENRVDGKNRFIGFMEKLIVFSSFLSFLCSSYFHGSRPMSHTSLIFTDIQQQI